MEMHKVSKDWIESIEIQYFVKLSLDPSLI